MTEYLFLYGTLKPNEAASDVAEMVRTLRCIGSATVPGRLYDFGDYPGAVLQSNSGKKFMERFLSYLLMGMRPLRLSISMKSLTRTIPIKAFSCARRFQRNYSMVDK